MSMAIKQQSNNATSASHHQSAHEWHSVIDVEKYLSIAHYFYTSASLQNRLLYILQTLEFIICINPGTPEPMTQYLWHCVLLFSILSRNKSGKILYFIYERWNHIASPRRGMFGCFEGMVKKIHIKDKLCSKFLKILWQAYIIM